MSEHLDPFNRSSLPGAGRSSPKPLRTHVLGGLQLSISVLLGLYAGHWLDEKWGKSPWLMLTGAALGLGVGLYSFLKPYLSRESPK